jgi:glucose-6-phosphate isomerase
MLFSYDFNGVLDSVIGSEHGLSLAELQGYQQQATDVHNALQDRRRSGELGFFDVPTTGAEHAAKISAWAKEAAPKYDAVVHLGIGGSGLGPICVQSALNSPYYNEDAKLRTKDGITYPRLYIVDNADPEMIAHVDRVTDPAKTLYHVVSKSGTTPETMTAFMFFLKKVQVALGQDMLHNHFVFTTDPEKGVLRPFAQKHDIQCFEIPPNVGGRFSVLTPVGLVPAALCGIDVVAMLKGAEHVQKACESHDLMSNPAYMAGLIHYLLDTKKEKNIAVLMPYAQSLKNLAAWFGQLWAESLGKANSTSGETINVGQTPVGALGATDQHSQVQLYVEGPYDKLVTFMMVKQFRDQCAIPEAEAGLEAMKHFGDHDFSRLLNTELEATMFAITRTNRPTTTITVETVNEETIGGLFQFFELQTAFAGGLYDIDAFDQPGVEEGKKATHALMGRWLAVDATKLEELKEFQAKLTQKPISIE